MNNIIDQIKNNKSDYIFISTSSRSSLPFTRLPNKILGEKSFYNILITNVELAKEFFSKIDGFINIIMIDVERKQEINLFSLAKEVFKISKILPYKPNDITLEAADKLLVHINHNSLCGKKVIIFGTGNLSFKIALRLIERESNIYVIGRDKNKVISFVSLLNQIKPKFSEANAKVYSSELGLKADGLISFVTAEKIVGSKILNSIKNNGFAIDGGIGNFKEDFIIKALEREITLLRLDVRLGDNYLLSNMESLNEKNNFFSTVLGEKKISGINFVAGGIIGSEGSVVIDKLLEPTQIIGIANGYGGLKNNEQLTELERKNLLYATNFII